MANELKLREADFRMLSESGVVRGSFWGESYFYAGLNHDFTCFRDPNDPENPSIAEKIARCYLTTSFTSRLSQSAPANRREAVKNVLRAVGHDIQGWTQLSSLGLSKILTDITNKYPAATAYAKANGMKRLIQYLLTIQHRSNGKIIRFTMRRSIWSHGLAHPSLATIDPTTTEFTTRSKSKHNPNIHIALGQIRKKLIDNPSIEPLPGYDRIRIEGAAFAISIGLRIGEIVTLPRNVLGRDPITQAMYARVYTEKGDVPAARPVPKIWEEALEGASKYLLNVSADARARAREIELNGFTFIRDKLLKQRESHPLSAHQLGHLFLSELAPDQYFFFEEIERTFSITRRSLTRHCVSVHHEAISRVAWMVNERIVNWSLDDLWPSVLRNIHRNFDHFFKSNRWPTFSKYPLIAKFFKDLKMELILHGSPDKVPEEGRMRVRAEWALALQEIRATSKGNRPPCVVNVESLTTQLRNTYSGYLESHYKKVLPPSAFNDSRSGGTPSDKLPLSEHLFVVWDWQFQSWTNAFGILPRPINHRDFYCYLRKDAHKRTVFERFNVLDSDGKPFSFSPHMARHWVTDALMRSGPMEMVVDLWMGRVPGQSRHYDHRTAKERAEHARSLYSQAVVPNDYLGRLVIKWREENMTELEIQRLIASRLKVLHFVPTGGCSRELAISPCDRGLMCLRGFGTDAACKSFHIDPTDMVARDAIKKTLDQYLMQIKIFAPELSSLKEIFNAELNTTESLDQHLAYMISAIKGCELALSRFTVEALNVRPNKLVRVVDGAIVDKELTE